MKNEYIYKILGSVFLLFVILSVYFVYDDLKNVYFENKSIFLLLLPFLLIYVCLYFLFHESCKDISTTSAIILAILIFIFQNHLTYNDTKFRNDAIENFLFTESFSNCLLSRQLRGSYIKDSTFFADLAPVEIQRFLTDGYLENIPLVAKSFGNNTATFVPGAIKSMTVGNRVLDEINREQRSGLKISNDISVNLFNIGNDVSQTMCRIAGIYDSKFDAPKRLPYETTKP